jgi:phenylacetate-CoA ligase
VVRSQDYDASDDAKLIANLRDRVGQAIRINIEYVDEIPLTARGKFKFVVSSLKPERH